MPGSKERGGHLANSSSSARPTRNQRFRASPLHAWNPVDQTWRSRTSRCASSLQDRVGFATGADDSCSCGVCQRGDQCPSGDAASLFKNCCPRSVNGNSVTAGISTKERVKTSNLLNLRVEPIAHGRRWIPEADSWACPVGAALRPLGNLRQGSPGAHRPFR